MNDEYQRNQIELFDFSLNHPDKPALDPVVIETDRVQVVEAINRAFKIIVARIVDDYSTRVPYEIAVLAPPSLSPYGGDLYARRLILDDFVPNDTVFILTKSVGDKIFIKPADKLRWDEFYFRAVLWQQGKVGDPPKLEVTAPHLQGKITIIDD